MTFEYKAWDRERQYAFPEPRFILFRRKGPLVDHLQPTKKIVVPLKTSFYISIAYVRVTTATLCGAPHRTSSQYDVMLLGGPVQYVYLRGTFSSSRDSQNLPRLSSFEGILIRAVQL